jgi:hypothetical protein
MGKAAASDVRRDLDRSYSCSDSTQRPDSGMSCSVLKRNSNLPQEKRERKSTRQLSWDMGTAVAVDCTQCSIIDQRWTGIHVGSCANVSRARMSGCLCVYLRQREATGSCLAHMGRANLPRLVVHLYVRTCSAWLHRNDGLLAWRISSFAK